MPALRLFVEGLFDAVRVGVHTLGQGSNCLVYVVDLFWVDGWVDGWRRRKRRKTRVWMSWWVGWMYVCVLPLKLGGVGGCMCMCALRGARDGWVGGWVGGVDSIAHIPRGWCIGLG